MHPSRIGAYPIEREVGRGGMGVVYRARDPRLDRPIAIKVLPDEFARDPERLARFEREARLLAALVHPNIAAIHGLEEADGHRFLVLEFVEGETLAQRLASGPLTVAETLDVGRQIAAALEAAHEAGIVHRDLKPGNVILTPAGDAKVLDFGLARGSEPAGAESDPNAQQSPTLTFAATGAGVILGTAAYMSPEQARGRRVDRRTDIWSFGAVLYECLTAKQAFPGETVSDSIARILQTEPDPAPLPADLPPRLRALLSRCLEKDARRRLRDIGDARIELEEMMGIAPASSRLGHDSSAIRATGASAVRVDAPAGGRLRPALVLAAVALTGALVAWFAGALLRPDDAAREPLRYTIKAPAGWTIPGDACMLALSPDGRTLAFVAADSLGVSNLWLRPLDSFGATLLPGTEGALLPFWAPDGKAVAFFALGKLRRSTIGGGNPEAICDAPNPRGGSWGSKGVIVFAPTSGGPLHRVDATGGASQPVTGIDSTANETAHRFPCFLPDGERFLYVALPAREGRFDVWIGSTRDPARDGTPVLRSSGAPIYAESGHLLFAVNAKLMAQAFDAGSGRVQGEPFVIGDPPAPTSYTGAHPGSVSRTGVLAWTSGPPGSNRLAYLTLDGRMDPVPGIPERSWSSLAASPDGRYATVEESHAGTSDLWLIDLTRGLATRLTTGTEIAESGAFLPDSRSFLFGSNREGLRQFYRRRVDGAGGDSLVYRSPVPFKNLVDVTPDGAEFLFHQVSGDSGWDIYAARFDSPQPRPVVVTRHHENGANLSPDGRWLAWLSDESGAGEVYVAAYPGVTGKQQVSRGALSPPLWSVDGRTIWFAQGVGNMLMAARFDPGTGEVATPREVRPAPPGIIAATVLPDDRFLVIHSPQQASGEIAIAVDWATTQPAAPSAGRNRAR